MVVPGPVLGDLASPSSPSEHTENMSRLRWVLVAVFVALALVMIVNAVVFGINTAITPDTLFWEPLRLGLTTGITLIVEVILAVVVMTIVGMRISPLYAVHSSYE